MLKNASWWMVGGLLAGVFGLTLVKPPDQISQMLFMISSRLANYALLAHAVMLAALALGLLIPKARNQIFAGIMALLAGSAAAVALVYFILPNIIVFGLYLALILLAAIKGRLRWELSRTSPASWFFGLTGLVFGFWYLHWVPSPIMLNALLYSPLGIINCPTMLAISGFLCLSSQRPALLDFTTGLVCVYFGLFGIFFLGAYVDLALVACGCYQLARVAGVMRQKQAVLG